MIKRITGLFITGGLLLILLLTIMPMKAQGQTKAEVLKNSQEFANALLSDGLSKEEVDLIIEFDNQVKAARKNGASREELVEMTFEMNEKMGQRVEQGMDQTISLSPSFSRSSSASFAGIYANCATGVTARWITGQGHWSGYFQELNGGYHRHSGNCNYNYCGQTRAVIKDYANWEYHLAVGNNYPFHTYAGCIQ